MADKVKVFRDLTFKGVASHNPNVKGPLQEELIHLHDHFLQKTLDTTFLWTTYTTGATGSTVAISTAQGGLARFTTGSVDDDSCALASEIIFSGTKKAFIEVRLTLNDVSGTGVFVGFSDAKNEANNSLAIHYPSGTLTTVATNAAGFVIDADYLTSSIMCCSVKADVDTTPVDTAVDWADGGTKTLRVELDGTTAIFFLNGTAVARIASSVTAATLLCATVQAITRANDGSNTVDVDRVDIWQVE